MEIFIIVCATIFLIAVLYIILGIVSSVKINHRTKNTCAQLHRAEWRENIPDKLINPPCKMMYMKSKLGYDLAARFFPVKDRKSHKYMILMHGYNNCSITCGKYALLFNKRGINCLALDQRRAGESKGRGITFGYFERSDTEQWIEEIYKMDPEAEIGMFGISLGAATAILVSSLRNDIKYVISYCSFSSFKDIINAQGAVMYPKFYKILYPAIVIGGFITTGARLDMVDIEAAIKNVTCPIMIMHSKTDAFTPIDQAYKLLKAKPEAVFRTFEKAVHSRSYSKQPEVFTKYVYDFLESVGY